MNIRFLLAVLVTQLLQAKECNGWTPLHDLMASGAMRSRFSATGTPCVILLVPGGDAASCVVMLDGGADRAIRDAEGHTSVYLMAE